MFVKFHDNILVLSNPLPSPPLPYPTLPTFRERRTVAQFPILSRPRWALSCCCSVLLYVVNFVAVVAPCFENLPTVG